MRVCNFCHIEKEDDCFRRNNKKCKSCEHLSHKQYRKRYWEERPEQRKEIAARSKKKHIIERRKWATEYRNKNKDRINALNKISKKKCIERVRATARKYKIANKEKVKKYLHEYSKSYRLRERTANYYKNYRQKNAEKLCEKQKRFVKDNPTYNNEYTKQRRKVDDLFRLSLNLRGRVSCAFRNNGYKKHSSTENILGASFDVVKDHIKSRFTDGMSLSKIGKEIHIDHVIPLASAKTENELIALCHYTNLQPLWALDNHKKGARIIKNQNQYANN